MILPDANLLIYAYHPGAAQHESSRKWLEYVLSRSEAVRFAWMTLSGFLRIMTNPKVFEQPLSIAEAVGIVSSWLERPNVDILEPGDRYWVILQELLVNAQCTGTLVSDAALAALAIEHGAILHTTDQDFARFDGLTWKNPLKTS